MKEYHKIQTAWLRDPATKMKTLLEGQWAKPEFEYLAGNKWLATEKVDGTNIRVHWDGSTVRFSGRTDNSQIPASLVEHLNETFQGNEQLAALGDDVTLYGEGYGNKIQRAGADYLPDRVSFILFDVMVNGVWLRFDDVCDIAEQKLGIERVPVFFVGTLHEIIAAAREGGYSRVGHSALFPNRNAPIEGFVARPVVDMCDRMGGRVITKIKCKDFQR